MKTRQNPGFCASGNDTLNYFKFEQRRHHLKNVLFFLLLRPFCLVEQNHFGNFGNESYETYLCEIILNLGQQLLCHLKIVFLFLSRAAILFGGAKPFGQFW